jgi:hypothetical protein
MMLMEPLPRCFLLPIDGARESLRSVDFLSRLYHDKERIDLILCYFLPQLPPIYMEKPDSPQMARKRLEVLRSRERETRAVFGEARKILMDAGFPDHTIQEHVEEKVMSVAHQACMLADLKKVDAVLVHRNISSTLEGFLKGDSTPSLLRHCLVSPVWFAEGTIDVSQAVVCVNNSDTALRAADHAAFMLAETNTRIDVLHLAPSILHPIYSNAFSFNHELEEWLTTPRGVEMRPFLEESRHIMEKACIDRERVRITILPGRHDVASDLLAHCRQQGIGILVLGYSDSTGTWGFLKSTITKKILSNLKDMVMWVNQ